MSTKLDPIREKYFAPLERAEVASMIAFYVAAITSLLVVLIDRVARPAWYETLQVMFLVLVVTSFALGLAIRFYWAPRAADKRTADFVSNAFGIALSSDRTRGYYNNDEQDPIRKVASQILENAFFTKELARLMCAWRRGIVASYAVLWIAAVAYRGTPIDVVVVGCQVLLSEEIITAFVRLEWLRANAERIFESMFRHYQAGHHGQPHFAATVVESLVCYETIKATAGVTLSNSLFQKNNARLSREWTRMRASLP